MLPRYCRTFVWVGVREGIFFLEALGDDGDPVQVAVAREVVAGVVASEVAVLEVSSGVEFGGSCI